jgi:hypothetical protein
MQHLLERIFKTINSVSEVLSEVKQQLGLILKQHTKKCKLLIQSNIRVENDSPYSLFPIRSSPKAIPISHLTTTAAAATPWL